MDPVVLSFLLGVGACLLRSDLHLSDAPSIYRLPAVGFKGGVELAK